MTAYSKMIDQARCRANQLDACRLFLKVPDNESLYEAVKRLHERAAEMERYIDELRDALNAANALIKTTSDDLQAIIKRQDEEIKQLREKVDRMERYIDWLSDERDAKKRERDRLRDCLQHIKRLATEESDVDPPIVLRAIALSACAALTLAETQTEP